MKWFGISTAAVLLAVSISPALGQEPRGQSGQEPRGQSSDEPRGQSPAPRPASPSQPAERTDAQAFINELTIAGLAEVQLGKIASEKGANADVKAFGQMMVRDHTQGGEELKKVAAQLNIQPTTQLDQKHKELVDKLSRLQGAEFDREYMSAMVQGHQEVLGKLQARAQSQLPAAHGAAAEHPGARTRDEGQPNSNKPVSRDDESAGAQAGRGATTNHGQGDTTGRGRGDEALTQWAAKSLPRVQMHLDRAKEIQQKLTK